MAELEVHFPDGLTGFKPLKQETPIVIGRGANADIQIDQPRIASEHCVIQWDRNAFRLQAVGKGRNVRVNGNVVRFATLKPDDEITLAQYRFVVRAKPGELIYDSMDFQFELDELEDAERREKSVRSQKPSKKPKAYYVPLYRSPLFLSISGALLTLCIVGGLLFLWVRSRSAEKQYDAAMTDISNGLYASAIRRFDRFLEAFPEGELSEQAIVWRGIARVQQFAEGSAGDWEAGLKAANQLYEESAELDFYRQRSKEIFTLFHRIGLGLAKKATQTADASSLDLADQTVALIYRAVPASNIDEAAMAAISAEMQEAQFVIGKDRYRSSLLAKMEESLQAGEPIPVYQYWRQLYGRYPELISDEQAMELRDRAAAAEAKKVQFTPLTLPEGGATLDPAPSWTVYRRSAEPNQASAGELYTLQVQDTIFAVDTGNGTLAWRYTTGFAPSFSPEPVPGDSTRLLVHCSTDNVLAVLDAKTGKPRWQQKLADRMPLFGSRPLIRRGQIMLLVSKADEPDVGRMLVLNLQTGKPTGEYLFPQPLCGSPVLDSRRDGVFVVGTQSSIYDIHMTDQVCRQVIRLDHEPGAIASSPVLAGRFLLVVENSTLQASKLRCLVISDRDGSIRQRQVVDLSGAVWAAPAVAGGRLFITTDKDRLYAFELGGENDPKPMTPLLMPPNSHDPPGSQPLVFPSSERDCWTVGRKLRYYHFALGRAVGGPDWERDLPGPAVAPPAAVNNGVIIACRDLQEGFVWVEALDVSNKKARWRCQLGLQPEAVRTDPNKPDSIVWLDQAGTQDLSLETLRAGEVRELPIPERSIERERDRFVSFRTLGEWTDGVVQWAGIGQDRMMYFPPGGGRGIETILPSPMSGKPAVLGNGILVPAADGFLYWIDPTTGGELAEPFMGPYQEGQPSRLRSVAALNNDSITLIADQQVLRLQLRSEPFPHFEATASVELESVASTQLVSLEDRVFMAHGKQLLSLQPETLEVLDRWSLEAPVSIPPVTLDQKALFITDQNEVVCLGGTRGQITIQWNWKVGSTLVGHPLPGNDCFYIALSNGTIYCHSTEEHEILQELHTGHALIDGPWPVGDGLAVLGADGSITTVIRTADEGRSD